MQFEVKFHTTEQRITPSFGKVQTASDGGYERGYAAGHDDGIAEGYTKGHKEGVDQGYADGLAARTYETWTITLVDGSVIEKDVALL